MTDPLRKKADSTAKRLSDDKGYLRSVIEGIVRESAPHHPTPPQEDPAPIQIWHPEQIDGNLRFVRPPGGRLGDHYADRQHIPEKPPGVHRVCWFGESVATGYLYAPWLTPAGLLENTLNHTMGKQQYEVIDLARTNETLDGMQLAIERSLQLNPDTLVIFAGNNWNLLETPQISPRFPDASARNAYGNLFREKGIFGLIERAARERLEKAGAFLASVAALAGEHKLEVILVIPEVNLADWEERQPVPWLSESKVAKWYALYAESQGHIKNGEWEEVISCAEKMLDLDDGCIPTGFNFLVKAMIGMKQPERARLAGQTAKDSSHFSAMCFLGVPRISSMEQELMRRGGRFHGFRIVDLRKIFSDISGNAFPGRRWFLDYCHLTKEGLQVTAAAVAEQIFAADGKSISLDTLRKESPPPVLSAAEEAAAQLGAALHTAHRMSDGAKHSEMVAYWLDRAVKTDPEVIHRVWDLIELRVSGSPPALTKAQTRNVHADAPILYAHGWDYPHLDAGVLEQLAAIVKRTSGGAERWAAVCKTEDRPALDLLTDLYYLSDPLARPYYEITTGNQRVSHAYFRAFWPSTGFAWVGTATYPLRVRICARVPEAAGGRIIVRVNSEPIAEWVLKNEWEWNQLTIPSSFLQEGINRLTIDWPVQKEKGDQKIKNVIERLLIGQESDIFPIFGELYALGLERLKSGNSEIPIAA